MLTSCVQPTASAPPADPLPNSSAQSADAKVLIYGGPGSWAAEVGSLKKILFHHNISYDVLTAVEMNQLQAADYKNYQAILFAGGDAPTVRNALTAETRARLRNSVQHEGLDYLGFCAGAWLAVAPAPSADVADVAYGIGVVDGPVQELNFLSKKGLPHALDRALFPNGQRRNLLWYGGPITPNIPGGVIAKYSDGTPAITQIRSGKGLVIVSGLHPAATKSILSYLHLEDPEANAPDFAWALLESVIYKKPLPAFP